MKKILLILSLLVGTLVVYCQNLEFTVFSGYTFGDKFPIYEGRARIGDGHTYGGMLTVGLGDYNEIEIEYRRQDAVATAYSTYDNLNVSDPVSVNYITGGINRKYPVLDNMDVLTGMKIGAGWFASKDDYFSTITKFSVSLAAGMKYYVAPRIAIRIQGNLAVPIIRAGGSLWWSPGSGTSVGLSTWSPITQFGFTGGLVFRIK